MNILFDLDGTLTDSGPGITRCLQHALTRLGRPAPAASALRRFVGPPLHETFAELLETRDAALVDGAVRLYRERFEETGMFENEMYPGVLEGLECLSRQGHRMWVATSKPAIYADRIVDHFGVHRRAVGVRERGRAAAGGAGSSRGEHGRTLRDHGIERTAMRQAGVSLEPSGFVSNSVTDARDENRGSVVSQVRLRPELAAGLMGLADFSHAVVVFLTVRGLDRRRR